MANDFAVIERMLECYNQMNADGLEGVLHPEVRHSAPGSDFGADLVGRNTIVDYFRQNVFPAFNKVRFETVHLWQDRTRPVFVIEWRSHLWPKSGKNYSNTGVFVIEMKDNKVFCVREYFDTEKAHQNVTQEV